RRLPRDVRGFDYRCSTRAAPWRCHRCGARRGSHHGREAVRVNPTYTLASQRWIHNLGRYQERLNTVPPPVVAGRLTRMVGLTLEAAGCQAALGARCEIVSSDN